MALFKRLPLRESVIRRTTIQALQMGAVNLSQGFPDDDAPAELKDLARQAVAGCNHQYTDPSGAPVLRRAIAHKLERFNGVPAHPDKNIVVTCGATEGMVVAMEALVDRGDEIITFAPMYENYVLQSIVSGLRLRTLETCEPDFSFTCEQLEKLHTFDTAAVLLCNPCNPTGKVFTLDELRIIAQFAVDHNLLIFADETYEYLVWPGHRHVSIASLPASRSHGDGDVDGQDLFRHGMARGLRSGAGRNHRTGPQHARFPHGDRSPSVSSRAGRSARAARRILRQASPRLLGT
jgi:aspartate/methionine/tyrosine aminotransferase